MAENPIKTSALPTTGNAGLTDQISTNTAGGPPSVRRTIAQIIAAAFVNSVPTIGFYSPSAGLIRTAQNLTVDGVFRSAGNTYGVASGDVFAASAIFEKSRGTLSSPTAITTGDDLAYIKGSGYVGATGGYVEASRISFDSSGTISDTASGIGGEVKLWTRKTGAASLTVGALLDQEQQLTLKMGESTSMFRGMGVANINTTAVGNVGTGEDDLMTYSLLANSLYANGKALRVTMWGITANNANAKTLKVYFGNTVVATVTHTISQVNRWRLTFIVVRTGSNTQDFFGDFFQDGTTKIPALVNGTGTETDTAALTIKATGTATADNDIVQDGMLVEYLS